MNIFIFLFLFLGNFFIYSSPKVIILMVVDQMRADYINKFSPAFSRDSGFLRLYNKGIVFQNCLMDVYPTHTAVGHATISTGVYPSEHGIIGNYWWDIHKGKRVYCVEDDFVKTVGGNTSRAGQKSPRNLKVSTFADKLIKFTNGKAKILAVSGKDRSAILLGGHSPKNVYWYDDNNDIFITSSYYRDDIPAWLKIINDEKMWNREECLLWQPFIAEKIYTLITKFPDDNKYEGKFPKEKSSAFPHDLSSIREFYGTHPLLFSPCGNQILLEIAKKAIIEENFGKDNVPDFIAISFSTPDIIGHMFGNHSFELIDIYARLDRDISKFLLFLDSLKMDYLIILTSDHGVLSSPVQNNFSPEHYANSIENLLEENFSQVKEFKKKSNESIITYFDGYAMYLSEKILNYLQMDISDVLTFLNRNIELLPGGIKYFFGAGDCSSAEKAGNEQRIICNSYYKERSPNVYVIMREGWCPGQQTGTTHGSLYDYDMNIPLIIYSPNVSHAIVKDTISITLLHQFMLGLVNMPYSNNVISEKYIYHRR